MSARLERATFGAGCFWGVEARFRKVRGVVDTAVGYMGGHTDNPSYEEVCTGRTGHTEVVDLTFDPSQVSYAELLKVFWEGHDPTTLDRQGPDVGRQYRSVVFYHDDRQREAAERFKAELNRRGIFKRPVVTAIEPAATFWKAEEYHQRYVEKHPRCRC